MFKICSRMFHIGAVAAALFGGHVAAQSGVHVHGSVYGAGKGVSDNRETALVSGNSEVQMLAGQVDSNVYGGGEMSSVGVYTTNGLSGKDEDFTACTGGKSTVSISGGQVGIREYNNKGVKRGGYVFGGGRGKSGEEFRLFAFVDSARVDILPGAFVTASVFGGAENGHVFTNTYVRMTGGKVGQEISPEQRDTEDPTTGVSRWLYFGNLYGGGRGVDAINTKPCEVSETYVTEAKLKVYPDDESDIDKADCHKVGDKYVLYAAAPAVAGVRKDSVCPDQYSLTAGRVRGNTTVHISGGRVVRNVYGGGSLASVGMPENAESGKATVLINGDAVIGLADDFQTLEVNVGKTYNGKSYTDAVASWAKHSTDGEYPIATVKDSLFYRWAGRNEGRVFGSGRGEPGDGNSFYTNMAYTKNTDVTIGGDAKVRGSVFGGGENGHVRQNTKVTIQDDCEIGVPLTGNDSTAYTQADSLRLKLALKAATKHPDPNNEHWESETGVGPTLFRGNVYGGGRGVDTVNFSIANRKHSSTAGRVYGNTKVTVTGGTIYHAVFGGGSLASVGDTVARINEDTSFVISGKTYTSALFDAKGSMLGAANGSDTLFYNYATGALIASAGGDSNNHRNFFRPYYKTNSGDGKQEYDISDTTWKDYIRPYRVGDPIFGTGKATITISGGQIGVTGINDGRVYGSGRGVAGDKTTLSEMINMAYVHNSEVYIKPGANIRGAVFGGGANGHVTQNTLVAMTGGTVGVPLPLADRRVDPATGHGRRVYRGNVYGGGRGVDPVSNSEHLSNTAGRVYGNTRVNISGGKVYHSVYGGGSLASVGNYNMVNLGTTEKPDWKHYFVQGTGMAVVTISGDAWIGHDWEDLELDGWSNDAIKQALYDYADYAEAEGYSSLTKSAIDGMTEAERKTALIDSNYLYLGSNSGMVFGSGRGVAALKDGTFDRDYTEAAFTNNTIVTIKDDGGKKPMICGSVFGGGENGHVKHNTLVTIQGGVIGGIPLHNKSFVTNATSDEAGELPIQFSENSTAITLDFLYEDDEEETGVGPTVYRGNVYGGGRGVDHLGSEAVKGFSATAGRVYGNAKVNVTGGHIYHHVFGGGSIASVGTYDTISKSEESSFGDNLAGTPKKINKIYEYLTQAIAQDHAAKDYGALGDDDTMQFVTGNITVNISGGHIGRTGRNEGSVFGGGRGIAGERTTEVTHLAFANNTTVNIITGAYVCGSVFGGGANGHVLSDAHVNISGGVVGVAFTADDTLTTRYGYAPHNVFHGNVYGGGRGVDPIDKVTLSRTAGRVYGNTYVTMTGGWVRHAVYGGGSLASVGNYATYAADETVDGVLHKKHDIKNLRWLDVDNGVMYSYYPDKDFDNADNVTVESHSGRTTVEILGGWVGARPHYDSENADSYFHYAGGDTDADLLKGQGGEGRNNGRVYGSCRGTAGKGYDSLAYVNITHVVIGKESDHTGPRIMGCVFGSGENGHVLDSTHVQMYGGEIGRGKKITDWKQTFIGNLYGGGRGVDIAPNEKRPSPTAGWVHNSTCVEVYGGHVWHNVFGGGSMATVGDTNHTGYENIDTTSRVGRARVIVRGGLIGSDGDNNGNVFGSGRGRAGINEDTIFINPARRGTETSSGSGVYNIKDDYLAQLKAVYDDGTYTAMSYPGDANLYYVLKGGEPLTISNDYSLLTYVVNSIVTVNYETEENANRVTGSVYGSGDNGHVHHDANVYVKAGIIGTLPTSGDTTITENGVSTKYYVVPTSGSVYGSGRGLDMPRDGSAKLSHSAGRVYGNTVVNVSGGTIRRNVYGGGNMASVGTYTIKYINDVEANGIDRLDFTDGTGTATVNISGSPVIGLSGTTIGETANDRPEVVYGCVFGSSRGFAGEEYANLAFVKSTEVNIGLASTDNPTIYGSVFGSGENGHVRDATNVTVNYGTIGKEAPGNYASLGTKAKEHLNYIGNVYGGGRGVDTYLKAGVTTYSMSAGYVRGTTTVTINGGTIHHNVYGGGSMGLVGDYGFYGTEDSWQGSTGNGLATVNILSSVGTSADAALGYGGNVYGSCRGKANDPASATLDFADMAYAHSTLVNIGNAAGDKDLTVYGNVYGGGEAGHVDYGGTKVNILSGTVKGSVFGGGKGSTTSPTAGIVDGNTQVNIGTDEQTSGNNVVVEKYVFGGNDAGSSPLGTMQVDVYHTKHEGANTFPTLSNPLTAADSALYIGAGAEAEAKNMANYALKGVYGGGNLASTLTGDKATDGGNAANVLNDKYITQRLENSSWPVELTRLSKVVVHYCDENTVQYVYGGGRAADTYKNEVTIEGGRVYQAFAGGDGSTKDAYDNYLAANVVSDASLTIKGGLVYEAFGGSNTTGVVKGMSSVTAKPTDDCVLLNESIFGGGNEAAGGETVITIPCSDRHYCAVYGGAKNANIGSASEHKNVVLNIEGSTIDQVFGGNKNGGTIYGNVNVNIYGGTIGEVFGGSNMGGRIEGEITVLIDSSNCNDYCPMNVDYVYGGGNQCTYNPSFTGAADHSPFVYVRRGTVNKAVFGGGKGTTTMHADTTVDANPIIMIGNGAENLKVTVGDAAGTGDVFGGGNLMSVTGNTTIVVDGKKTYIRNNVYGGGNQAKVTGNTDVRIGDETDKDKANAIALPANIDDHYGETHYSMGASECKPKPAPVTP